MKSCENCGNVHNGELGSGRFCSLKCSRGFSTKSKRSEINYKVSKTLTGKGNPAEIKECGYCKNKFEISWSKRLQTCCSRKCAAQLKWLNDDYRKNITEASSKSAYEKHKNPDIKFGWRTRSKFKMSYPESIAKSILDEHGIQYEYEYPFHPYFIDFAIVDHKIAIEIDGRQHNQNERMLIDIKKDKKLIENGWRVFRIKFPEDNIKNNIKNILADIPSA
jgi:very-short-patch-repair endonuclease